MIAVMADALLGYYPSRPSHPASQPEIVYKNAISGMHEAKYEKEQEGIVFIYECACSAT
jgi:hypothetical protein